MSYITLGGRTATGTADTSGHNPGNWTVAFTPDIINVNVSQCEIYHIVTQGAANTSIKLYIDGYLWDIATYGTLNAWDPEQPAILRPGNSFYLCYSDAVSDNSPPTTTIWLRYDPAITTPGNT